MTEFCRQLPTDIFCVKQIGLNKWQENFFWPISEKTHTKIMGSLLEIFDEAYEEMDTISQDLFLSDVGFIFILVQYISNVLVRKYCVVNNIELLFGSLSKQYYGMEWGQIGITHSQEIVSYTLKLHLDQITRNILNNRTLSIKKQISGQFSPDALGVGWVTPMKSRFVRESQLYLENVYAGVFLRRCSLIPTGIPAQTERILLKLINTISAYVGEHFRLGLYGAAIIDCWRKRLQSLFSAYQHTIKMLDRKKIPDLLLVTSEARPLHRIVAHAYRRKGRKTIGFMHGNYLGGRELNVSGYISLSSYGQFYFPTKSTARYFNRIYNEMKISKLHQVEFKSIENSYYQNVCKAAQQLNFPSKNNRVMILGFPMHAYWHSGVVGSFFLFQLDLELRLINLLKRNGYKVLYKVHPDRKSEAMSVFSEMDVEILFEPFEEVWHLADSIILKYSASSTFYYAVCVNRPVFWIDYERDLWLKDYHELLSKRFINIPAYFDTQNRIQFEEAMLLEKLAQKPHNPDFSFVQKYMIPDGKDL